MIVTAWNNGAHHESGAGYGLKVGADDRDRFFQRHWDTALVELEGEAEVVRVNVKKASFWNSGCGELISNRIGQWLRRNGHASWPERQPPKFAMESLGGNRFRVKRLAM